ncbi:MAG: HflK protein [Dehalococcoidia bacterium]|nr:MAG: HflK protein [Dehalococcoidia bacterium]
MMPRNRRPQSQLERDLLTLFTRIRDLIEPPFSKIGGFKFNSFFFVGLIAIGIVWFLSGFYQVQPSELAARKLFGKFYPPLQSAGLHWHWPAPVGETIRETVEEARRLELGFRTQGNQISDVSAEALMITGDLNIVDVQMIVQYRINDLTNFLFQVDDPGDADRGVGQGSPDGMTLKDATEAALRQVVGKSSIDDILTVNKDQVQLETLHLLRRILDDYSSGIEVLEVRLQNVRPPDDVRDAFDDVVRARVDKEARINEALAYQQDQLPRARGDAEKIINAASAFKEERILKAKGESARFLSVLEEYQKAKEVTRTRLYLEKMESVLPKVPKYVIEPESGGSLLQFLPLGESK